MSYACVCTCLPLQDDSNQDLVHSGRDTRTAGGISGFLSIHAFWNGDLQYSADGYLLDYGSDSDQNLSNTTEQSYNSSNGLSQFTLTTKVFNNVDISYDLSASMVIRDSVDTIGNFSWWASHVYWDEDW